MCLVVVLLLVRTFRRVERDPRRAFTSAQRREGNQRAGERCEFDRFLFFRCKGPAQHGDHWYPWSKGGATELGNYVAACAKHNLAKSAKTPTLWQTRRLEHRRRNYFPEGVPTAAGQKYRR